MAWTQSDLDKIDARIMELATGGDERRPGELQELRSLRAEMQRSINGGNGGLKYRLAVTRKGFGR
jgi:hypothetical protein